MTDFSSKRGEMSLADLLKALHDLPCKTQDQTEAVFHALGFNWQNSQPTAITKDRKKEVYDRNRYRPKLIKPQKPINDTPTFSAPPAPELPIELPKKIVAGNLKPLSADDNENIAKAPPIWLEKQGFQLLSETELAEIPPRESLFPTQTHRGILSAALTVKKTGQDININALISEVVKGRIPKTLPLNTRGTLEMGCQLLLDYNDSMVPFWEDLTALAGQIENLIGRKRVQIYEFDQNPNMAQYWATSTKPETWQAQPGRPVIVTTNLNITGRRRPTTADSHWKKFINQCEKSHIPLLLLIPWQESYWPTNLGNHPIMIHWNPATTATMLYSLIGKGHEVNR